MQGCLCKMTGDSMTGLCSTNALAWHIKDTWPPVLLHLRMEVWFISTSSLDKLPLPTCVFSAVKSEATYNNSNGALKAPISRVVVPAPILQTVSMTVRGFEPCSPEFGSIAPPTTPPSLKSIVWKAKAYKNSEWLFERAHSGKEKRLWCDPQVILEVEGKFSKSEGFSFFETKNVYLHFPRSCYIFQRDQTIQN